MSLKIIQQGRLPAQREWVGTCGSCKTVVEYLQEDAVSSGVCQREGAWSNVNCPLDGCERMIYGSIKPQQSR